MNLDLSLDKWGTAIVAGIFLAIWVVIAIQDKLSKSDAVCSSCGRNLDQTTTCKSHQSMCCACYGHSAW